MIKSLFYCRREHKTDTGRIMRTGTSGDNLSVPGALITAALRD